MYQVEKYSDSIFFKAMFVRLLLVYLSFLVGVTFFSNWRLFPSVDFNVVVENWGKFFFYAIWTGLPYLFLSQIASVILKRVFNLNWAYLADLIFVALFLFSPVSLVLGLLLDNVGSTFSFGVSDGEIIRDGAVTEFGKHYYFMHRMMEVFHMGIYMVLRLMLNFLWPGNLLRLQANS